MQNERHRIQHFRCQLSVMSFDIEQMRCGWQGYTLDIWLALVHRQFLDHSHVSTTHKVML